MARVACAVLVKLPILLPLTTLLWLNLMGYVYVVCLSRQFMAWSKMLVLDRNGEGFIKPSWGEELVAGDTG
jgi:hypothetical protein